MHSPNTRLQLTPLRVREIGVIFRVGVYCHLSVARN
jgi:hypothetical protein